MMSRKYAWVKDALSHASLSTKVRAMKHFMMGKKEYLPKRKTAADMDAVIKCALCPNMCKFDCPVLEAEKNEAVSPSGKMRIAHFIETGRLETRDAVELMYHCCTCDACREWCPFDFSVGDLLKGVRRDIVISHTVPEEVSRLRDHLEQTHTMDERTYAPDGRKNGDILYFMGCTVLSEGRAIAEAMDAIFRAAGEEYAVMEDEWCCGAPLHNLGFFDEFHTFAQHVAEKIGESGCRTVVCSCPTCAHTFKNLYPETGHPLQVEVMHATEYISRMLDEGIITPGKFERECVYHDPCTLARKLGITEEPRAVLKGIPGLQLREPHFSRNHTRCCGRGGQLWRTNPRVAESIAEKRREELEEHAACIVTACPACREALGAHGEVYDVSEIVALSMGDGNE